MGKEVLVVDLNPLSRSAKFATVTAVDEVTRVAKNLIQLISERPQSTNYNNEKGLQDALNHIVNTMSTQNNQ